MNHEDLLTYGLILGAGLPGPANAFEIFTAIGELPQAQRGAVVQGVDLWDELHPEDAHNDAGAPFTITVHHRSHDGTSECDGHPLNATFGDELTGTGIAQLLAGSQPDLRVTLKNADGEVILDCISQTMDSIDAGELVATPVAKPTLH